MLEDKDRTNIEHKGQEEESNTLRIAEPEARFVSINHSQSVWLLKQTIESAHDKLHILLSEANDCSVVDQHV